MLVLHQFIHHPSVHPSVHPSIWSQVHILRYFITHLIAMRQFKRDQTTQQWSGILMIKVTKE